MGETWANSTASWAPSYRVTVAALKEKLENMPPEALVSVSSQGLIVFRNQHNGVQRGFIVVGLDPDPYLKEGNANL